RRLVVVLRQTAAELAHVGHGTLQALVGAHDTDVVPHRVLDGGPVLQDQRGILHVLVARRAPIGNREQERVVDRPDAGRTRAVRAPHGGGVAEAGTTRDRTGGRFDGRGRRLVFFADRNGREVAPSQSFEQRSR